MNKIVIVNDFVVGGGVENVMYNLIGFLEKRNYEITLISLRGNKEEFESLYSPSIKFVSLSKYYKAYKRMSPRWLVSRVAWRCIKLFYKMKRYDVALAIKEGEAAQFVSNLNAMKKIAWVHVDYKHLYWTNYVFGTAEKEYECLKNFDHVVCVSHAAKNSFIQTIGDTANLIVKYNPLDVKHIEEKSLEKNTLIKTRSSDSKVPVFLAVGRLTGLKRYDKLLECCQKLSKLYDFELWIVGDGEEREHLEEFIKKNKMQNVVLWGQQDNPYPFIKEADWFVSTSKTESYGLAIQEAIVLGTPVIAMKCPAIVECVSEEYAILVEDDFEQLYSKLEMILKDHSLNMEYRNRINQSSKYDVLYIRRLEEIEQLWA